jgi:hypothetical protein
MTSLEEEFKKLLGNRYHLYTPTKPYERPSISELNKGKTINNIFEYIPNILLNNEFDKRVNDIVDIDIKPYVSDITLNLNRLQEQSLAKDNELEENINHLLDKVDKIIEYLEQFNKQIDEKISKAIDERLSKR